MNSFLVLLTLLFTNSYTNPTPNPIPSVEINKSITYSKVSYYEKDNSLIYEYDNGLSIEVYQGRSGSQMIVNNNGKYVGTLSGSGGYLTYQIAKKGTSYKGELMWKKIDQPMKLVLMSHPLVQGIKELTLLYAKNKEVTELEASLVQDMSSGASSYGPGTVTTSCSCGNTTVTINCQDGCGGICESQTKRRCHYGPDGTEESCEDIDVCVGFCLC